MSGGRAMKSQVLGPLDGESSLIAKRVQQIACTADVIVWVSSDERLLATPATAADKIPIERRVGVYGPGVLLAEIEGDMHRFLSRIANI
jgi:hypothetical protein